ncbi:hypothetical protein PHYPSEUDO_001790 [Phytophthora pseudosyringae]|uniref:Beta-glucan synthesis-associated protein n=1 Tax=Phytophthora pseudosyringae TaxID=221518 RepID=A0A8T1VUN5_9STRA|nr:hypothetical protein PHYPSEUDO_001790 [Phytophthora pseudosyringae]
MVAVVTAAKNTTYPTKSGIKMWVDLDTPESDRTYASSRGRKWDLVMSDEFNVVNRSFRPGDDHMWTSVEKPDGVNGAMELYSHNMTSTQCDDDGTCYFYIKAVDELNVIQLQVRITRSIRHSSRKLGAHLEHAALVAKLVPGLHHGRTVEEVQTGKYYPTWPGIWMMGNLGRAIFSASTNRMWPFSYDKCEPDLFHPSNQRISACDGNPGYGLNPNQGRGAPEIDVFEGGASLISSSLQIGPETASTSRPRTTRKSAATSRGYQGLRYAANNLCKPVADQKQSYRTIAASLKAGIVNNTCSVDTCPASNDVNADLGLINDKGDDHWGINSNGTCYPLFNVYTGSYLCDPDNTFYKCAKPRNESSTPKSNAMSSFNYQMDAISSNWPVHLGAYTDYLVYQVEWVTGKNGYVRWMLEGSPLFEVPSTSISDVPQNVNKTNPQKIMLEELMYIIANVALSSSWGATPPNPGRACRANGTDPVVNKISDNYMYVGCDPKTHPTKQWIDAHIDEYEDNDNKWKEVTGKAFCKTHDDCSIGGIMGRTSVRTGKCVSQRCACLYKPWGGPRCTTAISGASTSGSTTYGPPLWASIAVTASVVVLSTLSIYMSTVRAAKRKKAVMRYSHFDEKLADESPSEPLVLSRDSSHAYTAL